MKALVYTSTRHLDIQEFPVPEPKPGEHLVKVRAAGACGSDLDGFLGKSKKRVPPLVLGHEFCGEVVRGNSENPDIRAGDRVAVYPLVTCGKCRYCQTARHHICPYRKAYGLDFHGGFAEYVAAPANCLFRMPQSMSFVQGALVEPLANAIHVVEKVPSIKGLRGLVYGAGPIGALICWTAKRYGAGPIAVVDLNPKRLDRVLRLGADLAIDVREQGVLESILGWTDGQGVDFSVEAVGHAVCRQIAIECMAPGGASVWIGLDDDTGEVSSRTIVTREVEIRGSYAYGLNDFSKSLSFLAQNSFPVEAFVSEKQLDQGQQVFDELASGQSSLMKAVFCL
jgi:threonine dehydrogenase-like Zn-dependent dehydrogenase